MQRQPRIKHRTQLAALAGLEQFDRQWSIWRASSRRSASSHRPFKTMRAHQVSWLAGQFQ
jgi:hypothetical protein